MKEIIYTVTNPQGVHARPCALLAQTCMDHSSIVTVNANGRTADGRNVLELLRLAAKKGDVLSIQIAGEDEDEEEAHEALKAVIRKEFKEKKTVELLKIAFFGTKDYDRTFFSELVRDKGEGTYNSDIRYFNTKEGLIPRSLLRTN